MLLLEFLSQFLSSDQQRKVLLLEKDGSGLEAAGYQTPHRGYLSDGVQIQRKRRATSFKFGPNLLYESFICMQLPAFVRRDIQSRN